MMRVENVKVACESATHKVPSKISPQDCFKAEELTSHELEKTRGLLFLLSFVEFLTNLTTWFSVFVLIPLISLMVDIEFVTWSKSLNTTLPYSCYAM